MKMRLPKINNFVVIKVIVVAVLFALIVKDPDKAIEDAGKQTTKLSSDEEWVHDHYGQDKKGLEFGKGDQVLKPPDEEQLDYSRQQRTKQKQMNAIIREMSLYFIFILVLCVVAYGTRDTQAFAANEAVKGIFVQSDYTSLLPFDTVSQFSIPRPVFGEHKYYTRRSQVCNY